MHTDPASPTGSWKPLAIGLLGVLAASTVLPLVGPTPVHLGKVWAGVDPDAQIFLYLRIPRVLLGILAGGGLAVAGVLFQALVRDSLADPYVLGVAGGAAAGAVLAIAFGWREAAGLPAVSVAAFAGSVLALIVVLGIARQGARLSSFTLLLAGITVNSFCAALILLLYNLMESRRSFAAMRWLMGSLEPVEYPTLAWLAIVVLLAVAFAIRHARYWNLLAVGEEWATARGVPAQAVMLQGFAVASVLTGLLTAITGPIAFIGLMVPHAIRLRLGADHRLLLPASFLFGGSFLAACDTAARSVLPPVEIPVGVVTAMMGAPYFIWLLRSRKRSLWL